MYITLEKKAIVFKLNDDSPSLHPMMYFIENSFKNVKYFLNLTVISESENEFIRKKYLLEWAYKIYYKKGYHLNSLSYKKLILYSHLPIHIIKTDTKSVEKILNIVVDHINSNNELRITCNEYNYQVIKHFKTVFKDSMVSSVEKRIFNIKIKTKKDLSFLKKIISCKKISGISVIFMTHGLNFSSLNSQKSVSQEEVYIQKLKKSYKVLSITSKSTTKEIKSNYRKMLRKYHPDRVGNQGTEVIELYTRRFQVIQEAYAFVKEYHAVA